MPLLTCIMCILVACIWLPSSPTRRSSDLVLIELRVVAAVDHEHRSRLRFRVAFHLRRELTHLRRVSELATEMKSYAKTDRKSTRLNSSHRCISYVVFCLKKKI